MGYEENFERLRKLNQERQREQDAREAADAARMVPIGSLRKRHVNRSSIATVALLFVVAPLAEYAFGETAMLLCIGAACGVLIGYLLTYPR